MFSVDDGHCDSSSNEWLGFVLSVEMDRLPRHCYWSVLFVEESIEILGQSSSDALRLDMERERSEERGVYSSREGG